MKKEENGRKTSMKCYVAGYLAAGFGGGLIKWFTFGPYSHVSLLFADGERIEEFESIQGQGVHARAFTPRAKKRELFTFPQTEAQARCIHDEARRLLGCKYDWAGIWGFMRRRKRENPDKWFCSEYVAQCLAGGGVVAQNLPPWKQSPVIQLASPVFTRIPESEIATPL